MSLLVATALLSLGPTLTFDNGVFTISSEDSAIYEVFIVPAPSSIQAGRFSLRLNGVLVTFDQRGLGIQYAGKGGFTGLTYVPTTTKLFTPEQIAENAEAIRSGKRSDRASALSGYEIFGDTIYLLLRWQDKEGKPWLEALFSVDVSGDEPVTKLLGKFDGLTKANGGASDELLAIAGGVCAQVSSGGGYALGTHMFGAEGPVTRPMSGAPTAIIVRRSGVWTIEKTEYGTQIVSHLDLATMIRRGIFESRGVIEDAGLDEGVVVRRGGEALLVSLSTGALRILEKDIGLASTPFGVIVWSPISTPKSAQVWETGAWSTIAEWKSAS